MYGPIVHSPELGQEAVYSSTAWLANIALNCTTNIVNSYELITKTCSKVYNISKKVAVATFEVVSDVVVSAVPVCKSLAYCAVSEVITRGFPEQYYVQALSGIGAVVFALQPNPQLYRLMVVEGRVLSSAPHLIYSAILSVYGAQQIAQARFKQAYPLGYVEGLDSQVYGMVSGCEESTELFRLAQKQVGEFTVRSEHTGLSAWNRLEQTIALNVDLGPAIRFKEFIYALSHAAFDKEISKMWEDLDEGKLSLGEFLKRYKIYWKSEKKAIEVVKTCGLQYNIIVSNIKLNDKQFLDFDFKDNLDAVVEEQDQDKKHRGYIVKKWQERGYGPFCANNYFHNDCVTLVNYLKGRPLAKRVHELKIPICNTKKKDPASFAVSFTRITESRENRIQKLKEGPFKLVPELGGLVGFCEEAYFDWEKYAAMQVGEQLVGGDENVNLQSPTELYNLFGRFIRILHDKLSDYRKEKIEKLNKRGLLYKDQKYMTEVLKAEWQADRDYYDTSMACMKVFNKNSPIQMGVTATTPIPEWYIFEKFAEARVAKVAVKAELIKGWIKGKWPYCEKHPSEEGCTHKRVLEKKDIFKEWERDLTVPTCSKDAQR